MPERKKSSEDASTAWFVGIIVALALLATGDRELVEDSWRDDFWG